MKKKALFLLFLFVLVIFSGCVDSYDERTIHNGILIDVVWNNEMYIYINNTSYPYEMDIINIKQDSTTYTMPLVYGICQNSKGKEVRIVTENYAVHLFEVYYK